MTSPDKLPSDYPSPYVTPDEIQFLPPRRQFRIYHLFAVITVAGVVLAVGTQVNLQLAVVFGFLSVAVGLNWVFRTRPWLFFSLFGVLCLISLCLSLPPITASRLAALPAQCRSNMRQFALALAAYEEEHGSYPPAYIADAQGRPMHSWRVLLLPYLGEEKLYKQYRFDEPWNSPNNMKVADAATTSLGVRCPLSLKNAKGITQYVAVIGPETMWPGEKSRMLYQVTDSPRETILLIEWPESDIMWNEPRDLPIARLAELIEPSPHAREAKHRHSGGFHAVTIDGDTFRLQSATTARNLRGLVTVAGGEPVER